MKSLFSCNGTEREPVKLQKIIFCDKNNLMLLLKQTEDLLD